MLNRLLEDALALGHQSLEETRVRSSNLLCKVRFVDGPRSLCCHGQPTTTHQVFLQHLPALAQLASFGVLWMEILTVMDKYIHLDNCDLLVSKQWLK